MTQEQILQRLTTLERMIAAERNTSTLATLNRCYEKLLMQLEIDE